MQSTTKKWTFDFGMMLVELVGGSQPYEECRGISELITKIQKGLPPVVCSRISHKGVKAVIDACLQFDQKAPVSKGTTGKPFFADKSTIAQDANNNGRHGSRRRAAGGES